MTEAVLVIPRRSALVAGIAALALTTVTIVGLQPPVRAAVAAAVDPRTIAVASLQEQREKTENSIQRGYAGSIAKLDQVGKLTLSISAADARTIDEKARSALRGVRHDALVAVAKMSGTPDAAVLEEVARVETRLDQGSFADEPGVLLAPALFTIVARADELLASTTDRAIRDLTAAASPAPSPSRSPSPTPTPTPSGR